MRLLFLIGKKGKTGMKRRLCIMVCAIIILFLYGNLVAAAPKRLLTISLKDAILLGLRNNPTLESAELDRIVQKYALVFEKNVFEPQTTLTASFDRDWTKSNNVKTNSRATNIQPSISLKNHYGTKFTLDSTNPTNGIHYNPSLSLTIEQPLIQGFGKAIVDEALNNAIDAEVENKLTLKQTTIGTIDTIINDYFAIMQAEQQLAVDRMNLTNNEKLVHNDKIKIAAGKTAPSDIYQDQAQVASAKATIENQLNTLEQNKLTFLKDLGLPAETNFQIPKQDGIQDIVNLLTGGRHIASKLLITKLILSNNPQFQIDGIGLRSVRRALVSAQDKLNWKLDLTAKETVGGGSGGRGNGGFRSLSNHENHAESVGLELTIPVDDVSAKQELISARIKLEQADIAYQNEKRELRITALTDWNNIQQTKSQLELDKEAAKLQQKTFETALLKRAAGKISSFELIKNQEDLKTAEQALVSDRISYLQSLENLDKDIGITLNLLGIKIRY